MVMDNQQKWSSICINSSNNIVVIISVRDGVDLIEHLRGYIDGDVPGSVAGDVFTGIMSY